MTEVSVQYDMFRSERTNMDGGAEKKSQSPSATYDMFEGVYEPLTVDRLLSGNTESAEKTHTPSKDRTYTHVAYRHTMEGEEWKKEVDHDASMHLSIVSVLYDKLRRQPYCWCQSREDLEKILEVMKLSSPIEFMLRNGKKIDYIPSTRDTTRLSLKYIMNDSTMTNELDTIFQYSKYKYWLDLPMSEFVYIPSSTHVNKLPSIYMSITKSLYLWNSKRRVFPTDDAMQTTARSLRQNVMSYVFHNLYTCYMDGVMFHDLLEHEYTLNQTVVEDFYEAIASGGDFYNPCKDVFTDEWIRGHWKEWEPALRYLTYIAQASEVVNAQTGKTVPIHPGNTSDIFFLSQYTNRMIVLCNIQNGLSSYYHPYQVALPKSNTAHNSIPIFLYSESNGQYGILWPLHFGKPDGSKDTPPQSMIYQSMDGKLNMPEGAFLKQKGTWIVRRDPFNIVSTLPSFTTDLEYQAPIDLFLHQIAEESKHVEEMKEDDVLIDEAVAKPIRLVIPDEKLHYGSYLYPMNISNIDILKEYIEKDSDGSTVDDMPVDIGFLITDKKVRFINMNTRHGQEKYRQYVRQGHIVPV